MEYVTDDYINDYLRNVQPRYDGVLGDIQREATETSVPIIPHECARFLSTLLSFIRPENILEIGTAVGFSSSLMSKYLKEGGKITTIDRYDIMLKDAKENIKRMNLENVITILEGDAAKILPTLDEKYDFIFVDAAKGQYGQFLPYCFNLLNVGGIMLFDDVLQSGSICKNRFSVPRRQRTIHKRLTNFLWDITHNDALETSIIPIGDGMALCHKVKDIIMEIPKSEIQDTEETEGDNND